jgi:hypothetical protein
MRRVVVTMVAVGAFSLLPAGVARAGTVTRTSKAIAYLAAAATADHEEVSLGVAAGVMVVRSSRGAMRFTVRLTVAAKPFTTRPKLRPQKRLQPVFAWATASVSRSRAAPTRHHGDPTCRATGTVPG